MLIDVLRASCRLARCRRCGAVITWATTIGRGAALPFNGELKPLPAQTLFAGPDVVAVDTKRNPAHFATCPGQSTRKGRPHGPTRRR